MSHMHPFISHTHKHTETQAVSLPVALGSGTQPNTLADTGAVCMCVCDTVGTPFTN